jgi:hypothetical protein
MGDPVTIALMVGGMAMSAAGTIKQGKAQKRAAEREAAMLDRQSQMEQQAARLEAERIDEEGEALSGTLRALHGGTGGSLTGSAKLGAGDIAEKTALESERALAAGRNESSLTTFKGESRRAEGASAKQASMIRAGTNALNSVNKNRDVFGLG